MYVLGIDTGGTYTDAVLFDRSNDKVVAKAKSLTTRDNLARGIINAVKALNIQNPEKILLVSLSTTLATNSIVEGKGGRVALILIGYDEEIVRKYGPNAGLDRENYYIVKGRHDLNGNEIEPMDADEIKRVIGMTDGVDAYAVSSYLGVRNPGHELAAKDIITKETGLPVVCGTDLSAELDSLKRAATAALNAKLIPFIKELIESLRDSLRQLGVDSPLAVVKGDGSLMNWMTAVERPVETILSGPAASCIGAQHISSVDDAIVIDVGGTTTDIAFITGGRPETDPKGAEVGAWKTAVNAIDMTTIGIGGDSWIRYDRANLIAVGPKRAIPISLLCFQFPELLDEFIRMEESLLDEMYYPSIVNLTDVIAFVRLIPGLKLTEAEERLISLVSKRPRLVYRLSEEMELSHPYLLPVERLESLGVIARGGLTPTDILHVLGEYVEWSAEGAGIGTRIFSRCLGLSPEELCRKVKSSMIEGIARCVVSKAVKNVKRNNRNTHIYPVQAAHNDSVLMNHALKREEQTKGSLFDLSFNFKVPVIAVGAPVKAYLPEVCRILGTSCIIPDDADVANAIGAVTGKIIKEVNVLIRPVYESTGIEGYTLHTPKLFMRFEELEDAVEWGKNQGTEEARELAQADGVADPVIDIVRIDRGGEKDPDWSDGMHLETRLIITASGYPKLKMGGSLSDEARA